MNSLYKFLSWTFFFIFVCFFGILNSKAAEYPLTYEYYQRYYDNNGTLTEKTASWNESLQSYISSNIPTTKNSYGAAWLVSTPIPIVKDHSYSISFYFEERNNIALSSKNNIAIGSTVNNTVSAYNNSTYNAETNYSKVTSNSILSFVFKAKQNASFILIPWTTVETKTQNYTVTKFIIDDLGNEGLSQDELNSTISSQTNALVQNQTQNTENILNNQNQNTQDIINNQNQNAQDIIESNKVCQFIDISYGKQLGILDHNGAILDNFTNYKITDYIALNEKAELTLVASGGGAGSFCYYNANKTLLNCVYNYQPSIGNKINIPVNTAYARFSIQTASNVPTFKICKSGNQATNDKIDELNQNLTDTNVDTSGLAGAVGWLPPGPVDSIINLPLTMFNSLVSALGKTCSPLSVDIPFLHSKAEIPCLTSIFNQINGVNSFWSWVGGITSVLILFNYLLALYKWVDDTLSMRENTMPGYYDDNFGGGY